MERLPPGRHCFEFRHPSWFASEVYGLLHTFGVALVTGHDPRRPAAGGAADDRLDADPLPYGERGRRGNYSDSELREWAERIAELRSSAEVFAYFNNDWEGFAVRNGLRLRRLLEG